MIVLPFYCNLHLIHTFHFHLKYDYSVLKHISPVPSNYRAMRITRKSRHQEGGGALGVGVGACAASRRSQARAVGGSQEVELEGRCSGAGAGEERSSPRRTEIPSPRASSELV